MRTMRITNRRGSVSIHPVGNELTAKEAMHRLGVDNGLHLVEISPDPESGEWEIIQAIDERA